MSESFYDELDALTARHRQAEADKARDEANEERFKRLEDGIGKIGQVIDERLPANSPPQSNSDDSAGNKGEDEPDASGKTPPPPEQEEELEIERVTKFNVPKIYKGDDEPEIVKYIDAETGEEKTRKGRRKNRPVLYDVEVVPEILTEDAPGIPTEPDEASA